MTREEMSKDIANRYGFTTEMVEKMVNTLGKRHSDDDYLFNEIIRLENPQVMMDMIKADRIAKFDAPVSKLRNQLSKNGITFDFESDNNNVIVLKDNGRLKIAKDCFYRYSGSVAVLYRTKDNQQLEIIDVTDEMFIMNYIKVSIEIFFNVNNKAK
jgi:hypothetical protein